jgi:chemotaxis protein CheD
MTENLQIVPIGEMITSADPDDVLVIYGLGSCVVICLYDPLVKVGGMLHALLPGPTWGRNNRGSPSKFVNQGVPLLIDSLVSLGAEPSRLEAQLCGGARVTVKSAFNSHNPLNIGERNVQAARLALQAAGLKLKAEATGGEIGRTVKLHIANGQVTVKTLGQLETVLV